MERFMPSYKFSNPMDMEFDANGDLYMLEYGSGWFTANDDARLIKIEYNGGNRKPAIQLSADKLGGAIPFDVTLSAEGTKDADQDALTYSWTITSKTGFTKTIKEPTAKLSLTKPDVYKATLTVSDGKGGVSTQSMELIAGNEPPVVKFDIGKANRTFYSPDKVYNYQIKVEDKEDGSLENGKVRPESVIVNIDYLPEGYDKTEIARGHRTAETAAPNLNSKGLKLIEGSDCKACHSMDKKSIGPTYRDISVRYKGKQGAVENLTKKVISGGTGVWGDVPMAAHPQLTAADASEMVKYILSLSDGTPKVKSLPVKGTYAVKNNPNDKGQGVYIFRAAYKDKGALGLAGLASEDEFVLRNPVINSTKYDVFADVNKMSFNNMTFIMVTKHGSFAGLKQIDLTGIVKLEATAVAPKAQVNASGGVIELHIDAPDGKLIGKSEFIGDVPGGGFAGKPVAIALEPTEGIHDLYMVFKNPDMGGAQIMMIVMNTEFKMDGEVKAAVSAANYTNDELAAFAGKYKMTGLPFPYIEVSIKDGKLIMDAGGQAGPIDPTSTKNKFDAGGKAVITFHVENKNVSKLIMEAMGFTFEGVRE
jgi:cytochrome c